ncbi:MAG: hypothetical protein K8I00_06680, partial [Candidatus Omnitrophica bacterium]|nr:hypothetical protein [Candidatus Omnitrophota bacterium]
MESEIPAAAPEVETSVPSDAQDGANAAQIEELQTQVDQLTYQLRDQEENMRAQVIQFTEENKATEEKLQEALEKNKTLESAALESDSLGAQGAAKFFAVEEELRKVKADCESLTAELKIRDEQMKEQLPEEAPPAGSGGAELEELKAEVTRLTEDLKAKEERILEHQREMVLQEADRDDSPDMQLQLKSAEEMAQKLTEENSRLGQELQQKSERIVALQNEVDELKNMPAPPAPEESGTSDAEVEAANARIEVLDQQLHELRDAMDELSGAKRDLEEQLREREQEILTVNSEADIFKSQMREEQSHQKNKMEALQQEIDAEKERIHEQRQTDVATIETLKNENQALRDAGAGYQQRMDSLAEELKQIQEEHARTVQQ